MGARNVPLHNRHSHGGRRLGAGTEGSVHYEFTQAIALAVRPDRDIAFQVTVTFRHDGYRVIHSAADNADVGRL